MVDMKALKLDELVTVMGGAGGPQHMKQNLLKACGPQIDNYTAARKATATDPLDTRKEIESIAAGRSLAVCASNAGFDPPPAWRSFGPGK